MHPNAFLKSLWRAELRPEIFVAMSFETRYESRFLNIFQPAIEAIEVDGVKLKANRVDESKRGDSIITEIIDGIAHSQLVLADVSTIGRDAVDGKPYRNGNVLYEVGVALACRQSSEVLLVRDDYDKLLFDTSTIPHKTMNLTDAKAAKKILQELLIQRLKERDLLEDARLEMTASSLTPDEIILLKMFAHVSSDEAWYLKNYVNLQARSGISGLLRKQMATLAGQVDTDDPELEEGTPAYHWTAFGIRLAQVVKSGLPRLFHQKEVKRK